MHADDPRTRIAPSEQPLSRRRFLQAGALGAASALLPFRARAGERPPNVLLIMADDLGAECLGSYGGRSYETPRLDQLAREGLRFDYAYTTPLCTPSRVMMMTGRYPFRTGHTGMLRADGEHYLDPSQRNFAHVLRGLGYRTAVAGKWQLARFDRQPDHPNDCGFDEYCLWAWTHGRTGLPRYWDPVIYQNGEFLADTDDQYGPDVFCDYLIDFMTRNRSQPFLAYYPMVMVHTPLLPTPDQWPFLIKFLPSRFQGIWWSSMVAYMDKLVGRLVDALDNLGLREETLIIFTSDNGTEKGVTSTVNERSVGGGKDQMTEAGTRIPLIANWRGTTPRGGVVNDLVDLSDVLPTFAALGGAPVSGNLGIDGKSFAPQLRGHPNDQTRSRVFVQREDEWFARDHRWRLHQDGRLFDLEDRYSETPAGNGRQAEQARERLLQVLPAGLQPPPDFKSQLPTPPTSAKPGSSPETG